MAIPTKFVNDRHKVEHILMQLDSRDPKWAVPEMQRKFVWKDAQIIKLLASMFNGYPVGSILYWEDATDQSHAILSHAIGSNKRNRERKLYSLIIDGQQRLTSLKVIFEGMPVSQKRNKPKCVRIQFNPLVPLDKESGRFEIIPRSGKLKPCWIEVIEVLSIIGNDGQRERRSGTYTLINEYIKNNPGLSKEDQDLAGTNISRLNDLYSFEIPAVRLLPTTTHAEAAEIFVRINSSGTKLDMADFIMTTLALNSQSIKDAIHKFAEEAPESPIFELEPIDALTALVAFTFGLPAGAAAYELLKGITSNGTYSAAQKDSNLKEIEKNIRIVCSQINWSDFLDAVSAAGICSKKYLSSDAALLSSYAIYLHLIEKDDLSKEKKQNAVSLWLLFCTLTRRYSSHTDNQTKADLAEFNKLSSAKAIINRVHQIIKETLPDESAYAVYYKRCAENILTICCAQQNVNTLFSKVTNIRQAIEKSQKSNKLEEHHIFPKSYMLQLYMRRNPSLTEEAAEDMVEDSVDVIQNLAPIAASENVKISDNAPIDYVINGTKKHKGIKESFNHKDWDNMCEQYALPPNWWNLEYEEFINQRELLITKVIIKSFDSLHTI